MSDSVGCRIFLFRGRTLELLVAFYMALCYNDVEQINEKGGAIMTELETMQRAKMYLEQLARGINPISGQEMPEDTVLNNVRLARCFFYVSGVLDQVIANGGYVGRAPKKEEFTITPEQLAEVAVSEQPIRITEFVELVAATVNDPRMKKLSTTTITNWLLSKGFLETQDGPDGKSRRVPTDFGRCIGMSIQTRQGQYGEYTAVYYSADAQRYLLDHLLAILQEKNGKEA